MNNCSISAKRMGNDLVTGKKNINDITSSAKSATASTKALSIAMNVLSNIAFTLAITAVTTAITKMIQSQSEIGFLLKENSSE